jgi:hypothetical protein
VGEDMAAEAGMVAAETFPWSDSTLASGRLISE